MVLDPEVEIRDGRQRIIARNWWFSVFPMAILGIVFLVLLWELVRQNKNTEEWPWSLALLGVGPAATVCGVFASLLFAREQFARSMRPNLQWTCRLRPNDILGADAWTVHLMNVGPGMAHVESVRYSVLLVTPSTVVQQDDLSHQATLKLFKSIGLEHNVQFHLEFITPGAPLPVVKQRSEGIEFAAFKEEFLKDIGRLDFTVSVIDTMGDQHKKTLPFFATLPESIRNSRPVVAGTSRTG